MQTQRHKLSNQKHKLYNLSIPTHLHQQLPRSNARTTDQNSTTPDPKTHLLVNITTRNQKGEKFPPGVMERTDFIGIERDIVSNLVTVVRGVRSHMKCLEAEKGDENGHHQGERRRGHCERECESKWVRFTRLSSGGLRDLAGDGVQNTSHKLAERERKAFISV